MPLFSLCRKLCLPKVLNHSRKIVYSEFHTLRKLERCVFTRKSITFSSKRNLFWIFRKQTRREIIAKDNPPDFYHLIYRNGSDNYFLVSQYWAFYSSILVSIAAVYQSMKVDVPVVILDKEGQRPKAVSNDILMFVSGYLVTVCILYFFLARTPMRIYYYPKKQKYLFYLYGPVPNQIKKQVAYIGDIKPPEEGTIAPLGEHTYEHKSGHKFLLFENYFRHPADLYIMLGWQKDQGAVEYEKPNDEKKQ